MKFYKERDELIIECKIEHERSFISLSVENLTKLKERLGSIHIEIEEEIQEQKGSLIKRWIKLINTNLGKHQK